LPLGVQAETGGNPGHLRQPRHIIGPMCRSKRRIDPVPHGDIAPGRGPLWWWGMKLIPKIHSRRPSFHGQRRAFNATDPFGAMNEQNLSGARRVTRVAVTLVAQAPPPRRRRRHGPTQYGPPPISPTLTRVSRFSRRPTSHAPRWSCPRFSADLHLVLGPDRTTSDRRKRRSRSDAPMSFTLGHSPCSIRARRAPLLLELW